MHGTEKELIEAGNLERKRGMFFKRLRKRDTQDRSMRKKRKTQKDDQAGN